MTPVMCRRLVPYSRNASAYSLLLSVVSTWEWAVQRMNAPCERIIGSIRREMLDRVLIVNEAYACQVLAAYRRHSNTHRPHRARQQLPPDAKERPDATVQDLNARRVLRTRILGGVISEYRHIA